MKLGNSEQQCKLKEPDFCEQSALWRNYLWLHHSCL